MHAMPDTNDRMHRRWTLDHLVRILPGLTRAYPN